MTNVMDDGFISFYKNAGFGPIKDTTCVPTTSIKYYEHRLPSQLITYWRYLGWAGFANGLFWLVNPADYKDVVDLWLEGSSFEYYDCYHVIARSAFGELFLWGEKTADSLTIQTLFGQIFPADRSGDTELIDDQQMNVFVHEFMTTLRRPNLDLLDVNEQPLFMRLYERLGPLNASEMYGCASLSMEYPPHRVEDFSRVHAVTHMAQLARLKERYVMQDMGLALQQAYLETLM